MPTVLKENTWNPVKMGKRGSSGGYQISTYEVSSSWYNQQMKNAGDRTVRLQRYHDMDISSVEIGRALDIIAEDVSSCNADEADIFEIKYPEDAKIQKTLMSVMDSALEIWKERTKMEELLFERVRETLKYGATFYKKKPDGTLQKLYTEKMVGYILHPDNDEEVTHYIYNRALPKLADREKNNVVNNKLRKEEQDSIEIVPVGDLVVFKIGDGAFGESILDRVFTVWRQMTLIEDAVVIYRVVRAPERRIYYIDVGNLQGPKREQAIEKQRMRLMQKQANKKGKLTTEYDPHSTSEDIFIPTNSVGKGSRVETLPAGQNLGELTDLEWFAKKLAAGLRVPFSMIDVQGSDQQTQYSDMRVGQVYAVEIRYMGYVKRTAAKFIKPLNKNFFEYCKRLEINVPIGARINIVPPMSFSIYKKMELQQSMMNIFMGTSQIESMSKKYAMQEYLHMEHDDLVRNEIEKLKENGLTAEQIKNMPEEHISNIVYGDKRLLSEYGVKVEDTGGFR